MTWLTVMEYLCHKWQRICSTCRKYLPILSSFTAYYEFVSRLTRQVPLVEHLSSSPVFIGVCVTRSLLLYVCFLDRCLFFCTFFFGHCVVCSSKYWFWLTLWYLQTLLLAPWKSVIYKSSIKLRRFDWSEYNIVKGHMKV
jgi:hypothetical protein